MRIKLSSLLVNDQQEALDFYTNVLGFEPREDIPLGEFRWLTVASRDGSGAELSLEPNANPAAKAYQEAMFAQGIPLAAFEVDDLSRHFERLSALGVEFTTEPTDAGPVIVAIFADTCGNLVQLYQAVPQ